MSNNIFHQGGVNKVEFIGGFDNFHAMPKLKYLEIAFLGRSNVGKSTLINKLLGRQNIARTSQTPGRTQEINLFKVENNFVIADLPGYGYARIAKNKQRDIEKMICSYLQNRQNLAFLFLLIDSRRGFMDYDLEMMELFSNSSLLFQVILTKIDKIKDSELILLQSEWREISQSYSSTLNNCLIFSSLKNKEKHTGDIRCLITDFVKNNNKMII